jgi:hypothetical protein
VGELQHAKILTALAAHLRARRATILEAWRQADDAHPHLANDGTTSPVTLTRRYA